MTTTADVSTKRPSSFVRIMGLGLFCFVLSFLGAYTAVMAGWLGSPLSNDMDQKQQIVSQEGEVFASMAERVSPSVVSIVAESQAEFGFRTLTQQSAGTGIVVSKDGYILTNRHVVSGVSSVVVVMSDGTKYDDVSIVGSDPVNDIAFLKIKNVKDLKPAVIGDSSQMDVGEKVIAIGNALGQYQTSVTSGIISGLGRPLVAGSQGNGQAELLSNLLQTDAAINPGNSGGPLVNMNGEVIGINTAIDQQAEGIGFAIPINDAKGLIRSVTKSGQLKRAFLGVTHVMLTGENAKEFKLSTSVGAYVFNENGNAVTPDSPAEKAGIKQGDIITKVDNTKLGATYPLLSAISTHVPGDKIKVTYLRDGKEKTVEVTLADFPTR